MAIKGQRTRDSGTSPVQMLPLVDILHEAVGQGLGLGVSGKQHGESAVGGANDGY